MMAPTSTIPNMEAVNTIRSVFRKVVITSHQTMYSSVCIWLALQPNCIVQAASGQWQCHHASAIRPVQAYAYSTLTRTRPREQAPRSDHRCLCCHALFCSAGHALRFGGRAARQRPHTQRPRPAAAYCGAWWICHSA